MERTQSDISRVLCFIFSFFEPTVVLFVYVVVLSLYMELNGVSAKLKSVCLLSLFVYGLRMYIGIDRL